VKPLPPLLVITDRRQASRPLDELAEALLAGGCHWISLRENDLAPAERRALLVRLVAIGAPRNALIGVHRDLDAALATGAGSFHLPCGGSVGEARRRLGGRIIIGVSAHDRDEVTRAADQGADYVTLSPVFASPSKPGYGPALGLGQFSAIAGTATVPVYALGGIEAGNAARCFEAGAAGIAIMGAAMRAADPEAMIERVIAMIGRALVTAPAGGHSPADPDPGRSSDSEEPP
jgi:thiamine-phosphate pyrophosphorylase